MGPPEQLTWTEKLILGDLEKKVKNSKKSQGRYGHTDQGFEPSPTPTHPQNMPNPIWKFMSSCFH